MSTPPDALPPDAAPSPPATAHAPHPPANPHKLRTGLDRVWHAAGYSLAGLRAGWGETAFRQEALAALVLVPAAFWVGRSWVEVVLLAGAILLVMIVELLNTAVEAMIAKASESAQFSFTTAVSTMAVACLLVMLLCAVTVGAVAKSLRATGGGAAGQGQGASRSCFLPAQYFPPAGNPHGSTSRGRGHAPLEHKQLLPHGSSQQRAA